MIDEEVSRSTIAITVRASKLTARGLAYVLGAAARKIRSGREKRPRASRAPGGSCARLGTPAAWICPAIPGCLTGWPGAGALTTPSGPWIRANISCCSRQIRPTPSPAVFRNTPGVCWPAPRKGGPLCWSRWSKPRNKCANSPIASGSVKRR